MKAVILAGGRGSRLAEETHLRPKPMIEIGGRPIIWHIMKIFAHYGVTDFVVCLGYRGYLIKEYFANYFLHGSDVTIDLGKNQIEYHSSASESWRVTLVDSGDATLTGGRVKRIRGYLNQDEPFLLTYGDGVTDLDLESEIRFHQQHGLLATMTVVKPTARFGNCVLEGDRVVEFHEKAQAEVALVNGGFFVLSPEVLDLIDGDETPWEREPLERLVAMGQLAAWRHNGFWQPMDTLRDRELLEALWDGGRAPWKLWS